MQRAAWRIPKFVCAQFVSYVITYEPVLKLSPLVSDTSGLY